MAPTYSIDQYLLDRADIEDVAKSMYMHLDHKEFDALSAKVFADDLQVDYSSLLGIEPYRTTGSKQAETWKEQIRSFPKTLHSVTVLSYLARPGAEGAPDTATAVANGIVALVHPSGFINQNRARLYLDLVRTKSTSGNPWRVSGLKVDAVCVSHEANKAGEPILPAELSKSFDEEKGV